MLPGAVTDIPVSKPSNMNKRNWALLTSLVLLIITLLVLLHRSQPAAPQLAEAERFAVADTAAIRQIRLQQAGGNVQELQKQGRGWLLNDRYAADPGLMRLMLSVLHNVRVKRAVPKNQGDQIRTQLEQQGTRVQLLAEGKVVEEFLAGGEEAQNLSYFADKTGAYVVELPGYVNYISGIFGLSEANLRDRVILEAGYLNLQEASLLYPQQPQAGFQVRYDGQLLTVPEVQLPDSVQLFNFLGLLEALPVAGFVETQAYPELDSLLKTAPVAELSVQTSDRPEPFHLQIFAALPQQPYRLGFLPAEQQAVMLDERLLNALLIRRAQLEVKQE